MKKTHKVVMLPTDHQSKLFLFNNKLEFEELSKSIGNCINQHLYIISDDEIKEGDWFINIESKDIDKSCKETFIGGLIPPCYKKIVATTDTQITSDYSTPGELFVPSISESFIQAYNEGKEITQVDLEMEEDI